MLPRNALNATKMKCMKYLRYCIVAIVVFVVVSQCAFCWWRAFLPQVSCAACAACCHVLSTRGINVATTTADRWADWTPRRTDADKWCERSELRAWGKHTINDANAQNFVKAVVTAMARDTLISHIYLFCGVFAFIFAICVYVKFSMP